MNIYLVGFMGSGKSLVGRYLAAKLGTGFLDLDQWVEAMDGRSIAEIFEQEGEAYFREEESRTLRSLEDGPLKIVALGGGTPCFYDNMEWMLEHGIVIYLKVNPEVLVKRLESEKEKRPLLKQASKESLMDFINKMLSEREPVYQRAHYTVLANGPAEELAMEMEKYFKRYLKNL